MKLNTETKKMLANKIISHIVEMQTDDDLFVGAVGGGIFRGNEEAEKKYIEGVEISQRRHSAAISIAAKYLGFDRSQTADVLRESQVNGVNPVEAILARSSN